MEMGHDVNCENYETRGIKNKEFRMAFLLAGSAKLITHSNGV